MNYSDNGKIIIPKQSTSQGSDNDSDEFRRLDRLFKYMRNNKAKTFKAKLEDEELYYSDVEETRTQFKAFFSEVMPIPKPWFKTSVKDESWFNN